MTQSIAPPQEARYLQERELFEFFVTGHSALECGAYCLYSCGRVIAATLFQAPDDGVNVARTAHDFAAAFPGDSLSLFLGTVAGSAEFRDWRRIRNVLTHRSHPGRQFKSNLFSGPPAEWLGIALDASTTSVRCQWLTSAVNDFISEASTFFHAHP